MLRKPSYGEQQRAYMERLQAERHAFARKADPKAYDAYLDAQVKRHTKA